MTHITSTPKDHTSALLHSMPTVVVGLSGGVDSSVAALLLKQQGYRVIGLFMKNWEEDPLGGTCTQARDYQDVVHTCALLDIPYHSINFAAEYKSAVFAKFLEDLQAGLTPNPDILCNREIKFKAFFDKAISLGADFLATGHYAQIKQGALLKSVDDQKDQTYFLYAIDPRVLGRVLFPIGHLTKPQVRSLAEQYGLPTYDKKDSTGICFIGKRDFPSFISQYLTPKPGPFIDLLGNVVGQHLGAHLYTLGQRRSLGLGGEGERWFVVKKDMKCNAVYVTRGEHAALYTHTLWAHELNWLIPKESLTFPLHVTARIRHRQPEQPCTLHWTTPHNLQVTFSSPQKGVAPGQAVVFYLDSTCIGGGTILPHEEATFNDTNT